jgi:hypothetical protein
MDKKVFDVILNMLASGIATSIQTTDITKNITYADIRQGLPGYAGHKAYIGF